MLPKIAYSIQGEAASAQSRSIQFPSLNQLAMLSGRKILLNLFVFWVPLCDLVIKLQDWGMYSSPIFIFKTLLTIQITGRRDHRIIEWRGLEVTLNIIELQHPCLGQTCFFVSFLLCSTEGSVSIALSQAQALGLFLQVQVHLRSWYDYHCIHPKGKSQSRLKFYVITSNKVIL